MKRSIFTVAVLAAAAAGIFAQPTRADDKPAAADASHAANISTDKGKPGNSEAVSVLSQAEQLVAYARENESPTAMLAAVQMLEKIPVQDNSDKVGTKTSGAATGTPSGDANAKKGDTAAPTLDPQKLLDEAAGWAKGDEHLTALITAEKAKAGQPHTGTLGASGGAVVHGDVADARTYDTYHCQFDGGEIARVAVVGDGDTDLDLYVYDQYGNLIAKDDDLTDRCLVEFVPNYTSSFTIKIINNGYVANRYLLMTN